MQKFNGSLIRQFPSIITGNAAVGVQVTVYVSGTNTLATLYATNNTAGATLGNPLTTDGMGFYAFYAPDGMYRLEFSDSRYQPLEISLLDSNQVVSEIGMGQGLVGQAASAALQSIASDRAAVDAAAASALPAITADASAVDAAASSALTNIAADVISVQTATDEAIAVEIPAQIARLGLEYPPIAYTAGLTLNSNTKTYSYLGALYIWGGALGTITNGAFNEDGWQPIQGDIQLRNDVEKGTSIIRDVKHVTSVAALGLLSGEYNNQSVLLKSIDGTTDFGGGNLYFTTTLPSGIVDKDYYEAPNGYWRRINDPVLSYGTDSEVSQVELNQRMAYRPVDVTKRPPTRQDNVGYPDNSIWQHDKKLWLATRVSQGARAGWSKINDPIGAVGKVVTNATAVWWLSKVVPEYAGQCINVTNQALGTSADIGFMPDGTLDVNKLDLFLVGTKGLVNTWYDQSGNGHNLTSSGANRPVITLTNSLNGLRSIVFERSVIYNGVTVPEQFMTIPNTVAGNSNAVSIASLCRFSHAVKDAPIVQLNQSGSYTSFGKRNQTGIDSIVLYQNSSARVVSQVQPSSNPYFLAASIGSGAPGAATIYTNDTQSLAGTSIASAAFTGGKVGGSDALFVDGSSVPQNGGMLLSGLIIWNKAISIGEYRNIYRATARDFNLKPQIKGNIVVDGDSISEGAFATYFNNWPRLMEDLLQYEANIHLTAFSGGTVVTQNANRSKWESKIYSANAPYNLVIAFMGTNDLAGGATAATTYSNLAGYITAVKAIGYDVIVCTCLPRQSFLSTAAETERLAYNQLIRDNWQSLGCSYLVDFDLEGTMGRTDLVSNVSFYVDGTHPTQLGLNLLATYVTETVDKYVFDKVALA